MKYYYLVSGLPDIQLSDAKVSPMVEMAEEIKENLSDADANLFSLLLLKYDNENFLAYLKDNNAQLNPLGNLSSNDWEELVSLMNESDSVADKRLMPYIQQFYAQYTITRARARCANPSRRGALLRPCSRGRRGRALRRRARTRPGPLWAAALRRRAW